MKHISVAGGLAIALFCAAAASAGPLNEAGVTREQMIGIMTRHGLPARMDKDSHGAVIVKSRVADVNYDVYFYNCVAGSCNQIQFAAGWSNSVVAASKVNEWNTTKRFLRVYTKPGKVIWAEMDMDISRGTTENIDDDLTMWATMLGEFKKFMKL
jgi:hypothetical protein